MKVTRRKSGRRVETDAVSSETFFFRNFPEYCSEEDIRRSFKDVGRVLDIFIPKKRDKQGKRFGFVRFSTAVRREEILDRLNKVWIGSHIIRAFLPRYQRAPENLVVRARNVDTKGKARTDFASHNVTLHSKRFLGCSFSEVLAGNGRSSSKTDAAEDLFQFQSHEEDKAWLRDAFTGRLKTEFSWKDHGEEIQQECGGALKLTDMGNQLILIQSTSVDSTEEIINKFDEWTSFWLDWKKPWSHFDVNHYRTIWTRWIGVPLHAWSRRFFCTVSSKFGRLEELHDVTVHRKSLGEAYVSISTGLDTIDRIITCNIDGACFKIRIEEIRCMDNFNHLQFLDDLASESSASSESEWSVNDSVHATLGFRSAMDDLDGASVQGGARVSSSPITVNEAAQSLSGSEKAARRNNDNNFQKKTGLQDTAVGLNPNFNGPPSMDLIGPPFKDTNLGSSAVGLLPPPSAEPSPLQQDHVTSLDSQSGLLTAHPPGYGPATTTNFPLHNVIPTLTDDIPQPSPQQAAIANKGKPRKAEKKPHDPKDWTTFISPMASGGELEEKGRKKKNRKAFEERQQGRGLHSISREGWDFGKKLGLISKTPNADLNRLTQGEEIGARLGAGEDLSQ